MKYEIILYWSEDDNTYIAEAPELSGCMADGYAPSDKLRTRAGANPSGRTKTAEIQEISAVLFWLSVLFLAA